MITTTTQQAKQLTAQTDITSQLFKQWKGGTRVCSMIPEVKQCMQGKGTCIIANGHQFSGKMRNGIMNGKGRIKWTDGTVYEGEIQNNVLKGKGKYTWANGSTYDGDILNGLRHGEGKFQCPTLGVRYQGGWKYGLRHGYGVIVYKDGTIYKGTWQNGKKYGFGTMTYPSGNQYEGNWRNDMKHGKGKMVWKTRNERYQGGWEEDLQSGYGCHVWFYKVFKNNQSDHIIPQAEEEQQQKSNKYDNNDAKSLSPFLPVASTPDFISQQHSNTSKRKSLTTTKFDAKYPQQIKKHSFTPHPPPTQKRLSPVPNINTLQIRSNNSSNLNPSSTINAKSNLNKQQEVMYKGIKVSTPRSNTHNLQLTNRYLGEFREGVRFGQGIFFYSDGSKYEGQWENNVKHGYGVFTFADGDTHQGQFELDHMVNPPPKLQAHFNRAIMSFEDAKQQQEQIKRARLQAEKNKSKYGHMRSSVQSSRSVATDSKQKTGRNNVTSSLVSNSKVLKKTFSIRNQNLYENPFLQIIDIDDILQISCVIKPDSIFSEQKKQIANLLLRHNSQLKKCYRFYTNCIELIENQKKVVIQAKKANKGMMDQIDQQSCFCMRMRQFWRLLRDAGIRSPSTSIAQIDRCLAMAKKSRFSIYERRKGKNQPVGASQSLGFNYKYQKGQDRLGAQSGIFAPFTGQPDFQMRLQNQRQQFQTLQTQNKSGKMMIAALQRGGVLSSGGLSPTAIQIQSSGTSHNLPKKSSLFHLKKDDSINYSYGDQKAVKVRMEGVNSSIQDGLEYQKLPQQKYSPEQIDINWQTELKQFEEGDSEQQTAELLQELFVSYPQDIIDIHQSSQPIFFRQFVEGIVRIAFLQFQQNPKKYKSFYKATEQTLEQRILKNLGKTNIRSQQEQFYLNKAEKIFDKYEQKLLRLFECGLSNQQRHGSNMTALRKDITVTGYDILQLFVSIGMLEHQQLKKLDFKNCKQELQVRQLKIKVMKQKLRQQKKSSKGVGSGQILTDQKSLQLDNNSQKIEQVKLLHLVDALKLIQKGFNRQDSIGYKLVIKKTNEQLQAHAKKLLNSQFIYQEFKQILVLLIIKLQNNQQEEENKSGVRRYLKSFLKKVLFPVLEKMQEDYDTKWRKDFSDKGDCVKRVLVIGMKDKIRAKMIDMKQEELDEERKRIIQDLRQKKQQEDKKREQDMANAKVVVINQQGVKVRETTSQQSRTRTPSILDRLATQDLSSKLIVSSMNTSSASDEDDDDDDEDDQNDDNDDNNDRMAN